MLRVLGLLSLVLLLAILPGCIYAHVKIPLDTDLDQTKLGPQVKKGESSLQSFLWLFSWGDAGTQAAALDGGLSTVNHMDTETLSILGGLYLKQTTIVYGE